VIVAIMQPYFFPYIGYFQLMQAVDVFVFHDDVQYIKGGWLNRNRILIDDNIDWLTMPVKKAGNHVPINERHFAKDPATVDKMKRRVAAAYAKSRHFHSVAPTILESLSFLETNVADSNCRSLTALADKLGITCEFVMASDLGQPPAKGQEKVIGLCRLLGASRYINPIGGVSLYDPDAFADAGIELSFLRTEAVATQTGFGAHHLSVIDGLMRDGFDGYSDRLSEFVLLEKGDAQAHA
jgi:hypothetical protein